MGFKTGRVPQQLNWIVAFQASVGGKQLRPNCPV